MGFIAVVFCLITVIYTGFMVPLYPWYLALALQLVLKVVFHVNMALLLVAFYQVGTYSRIGLLKSYNNL